MMLILFFFLSLRVHVWLWVSVFLCSQWAASTAQVINTWPCTQALAATHAMRNKLVPLIDLLPARRSMIMHCNENKVYCRNAVSNVLRLYKCVRSIVDFQQLCGSRIHPAIVFQRVSRLLASFADRNVSLFSLLCVCNKCVLIHAHAVVEITPFAMSYRAGTPIPG